MPPVRPRQLLARLAKGQPVSAVVLLGEDIYLREMCRQKLVEAFVPEGARQWGVARFSLEETRLDRVLQQVETMPMLAPRQIVLVQDVEALEELGDEARERAVQQLEDYLENPAPFTVLVLEAAQLDQRTRLYKMLISNALVVSVDLSDEKDPDKRRMATVATAKSMVRDMARELGAAMDEEAADALAEMQNGELGRIRAELAKLATYVGDRRRITLADVDAVAVSEQRYSVWQLADMLVERDTRRALAFFDSLLREGEELPRLLGALAWMYRKLIEAQEGPAHMNKYEAAGRLRMRPEAADLALRSARRIPRAQLLEGLAALYEADSRLKSGPNEAGKRFLTEFLLTRLTA